MVSRNLTDGQGCVLLHLDSGAYHGANQTGARVWALLEQEEQSFAILLEALRQELSGAPATLDAEIRSYLCELERRDLVRFEPATRQP